MWMCDLLFHSRETKPSLLSKLLGCFFLMLGGGGGAYFLFQALIPHLGYLESGGLICGTMVLLGMCFLFIGKSKKPSPAEEVSQKISNVIKGFDMEKVLKENAVTLSLFSLGVGLILSQVKDPKKFAEIYNIFKKHI